ncbi:hypothetical protein CRUP_006912 [Coryphaenoides rupestris]|nr:hypothetical protein CRUP_006912 [Coryphaenoides rupestris]
MCYNDYKSHIYCQWRKDPGTPARTLLELWNWNSDDKRESLCEPSTEPFVAQDDGCAPPHPALTQCRFNVSTFAIGIDHTECASARESVCPHFDGRRAADPVVQSLPGGLPLSQNVTFQLDYRAEGQETWSATWCCRDPEVTAVFRNGEALFRYSCSLAAAHVMLELVPRRNVKSFPSHRNNSSWSPDALLYVGLSVLAAVLCIVLFFIAQAGRSLPFGHDALLQKEKMDISRVYHLDRFSSCSDTSVVSFDGPYIFCKPSPPAAFCSLQGDYVFLPSPGPSKSASAVEPEVLSPHFIETRRP